MKNNETTGMGESDPNSWATLRFAAKELTKCAMPYGPIGIRAAVYFLCAFLTMFMNNSATVVAEPQGENGVDIDEIGCDFLRGWDESEC